MKPGVRDFPRHFYWKLRRDWTAAFHILGVLIRFMCNALRLVCFTRISGDHRPAVAIALIEHMGDIVAAEPIARLARRRFPGARIYWITRAPYASLPENYPEVDHIVITRCLTEWMLLQSLGLFDVVWDLHIDGRICPCCEIPQVKSGMLPDEEDYFNYGALLDVHCICAGLPKLCDGPKITPPPAAVRTTDAISLPPRFIVIHCVSSDPRKDWPEDKWRELTARILATLPVAVVEVGIRPLLIQRDSPRHRSLCGALNVLETAEVIRRADLFIGIDSGPAHLANAVATTGVILLGSYLRFKAYMPYTGGYAAGATAEIIRAVNGPVADLSVDAVFTAVMARLGERADAIAS
jgi:heptosyltransferase III